MGLNGILSSSLTALQTNTSALRTVSQNISNLNTPNYARRVVDFSTLGAAGVPVGVTIEDIRRVSDQFLSQEALSATSTAQQFDTKASVFDQVNALIGAPGDGNSLSSKLSDIFDKLGQAQLSTNFSSSQNSIVHSMQSFADSVSSLSNSLDSLATQVDTQLSTSVATANNLIKEIYDYNQLIKSANLHGVKDTTYLDQRDTAVFNLAQQMDLRVVNQDDGSVLVTTQDGVNLVGASYSKLSYVVGQNNNYGNIVSQDTNAATGDPIGSSVALDEHLQSGQMRGLIDMRDSTIGGLKNELGAFAQGVALSFNAVHNANTAYPPPTELEGRDTGLVGTDLLNFTGQTTIALTNSNGVQQDRLAVDFSGGTITRASDGATFSIGSTVNDFTSALNSALGGIDPAASADFSNGVLTISGGADGVVVSDANGTPASSRGGTAFSQFFGLNDLFKGQAPSITKTGVLGSEDCGVTTAGKITFTLKNQAGSIANTVSVPVNPGDTFASVISNINTSLNGFASLSLNPADGSVSTTVNSKYSGYDLLVTGDTTSRGTTGVSLSSFFGIGANLMANQAKGFDLTNAISTNPSQIALAKADFSTTQIVGSGDSNGLLALQSLTTSTQAFQKAGNIAGQVSTLQNYSAALYQDIATQSADAAASKSTQDDRLTEAKSRMDSNSGVNLDEELSNMIIYQQAYAAGARMLTTVGQLYDTLMSIK